MSKDNKSITKPHIKRWMRNMKNLPHASEQAADPRSEGTIEHHHDEIKPKGYRKASIKGKQMEPRSQNSVIVKRKSGVGASKKIEKSLMREKRGKV